MKGTIEDLQGQIEFILSRSSSGRASETTIALGLTAIAYAIRDLAIAIKSASENRQSE